MSAVLTAQRAERLRVLQGLHLGLPGYWYPVLKASDLGEQPKAVTRFGEDLVIWRDTSGRPTIFEDRCPHRGVRMSTGYTEKGKIQGTTFACWYHGWTYDQTGQCVAMPAEAAGTPLMERIRIKAYPSQEKAGFIWMYYGQGKAPALEVPSEYDDPEWCGYRTEVVWKTNWLNILDNLSDPMHQYTLHGRSYITNRRPPFNRVRVAEETEDRLRIVQSQVDDDEKVVVEEPFGFELRLPGRLRVDLLNAAPGGDVRVLMNMVPIDAETSYVTYWRGRQVMGLQRLHWQGIWNLFYRRSAYRVASQDEWMLSTMGPLSETRTREHLGLSDTGVRALRKMMHRSFERNRPTSSDAYDEAAATDES